mgnify:CR=1 FL=1
MSGKANILTESNVPQYIRDIVNRLEPILVDYKDENGSWWGYTFRLNAKWKCGYEGQLETDCVKLVKWCQRYGAYAKVYKYAWWWDNEQVLINSTAMKGTIAHRTRALRSGWQNHAMLVISDPVAYRFEKANYYR